MVAAAVLALSAAAASAAPPDAEVRRVAAEVLADAAYQRALPEAPKPRAVAPSPAAPQERAEPRPPLERPPPEAPEAEPEEVGVWLAWVLGIAAAALLAFYALNRIPTRLGQRSGGERRTPRAVAAAPFEPAPSDPLAGADTLACAGNYAEAIHAILLLVLGRLGGRIGFAPRPSLTSREIVARATLAEGGRAALALIVRMAELSHFGGRAPSPADYRRCRESYHLLASVAVGET